MHGLKKTINVHRLFSALYSLDIVTRTMQDLYNETIRWYEVDIDLVTYNPRII